MEPLYDVPPPYSETDMFSHPGDRPPAGPALNTSRREDDAFSSSVEDVIYTPPPTPVAALSATAGPRPAAAAFLDSCSPPAETPPDRLEHTTAIGTRARPHDLARSMPGSWDQSFDGGVADSSGGRATDNSGAATSDLRDQRGWGMGGIRVAQDGISIGNVVAADRFGIRLGPISADQSGISADQSGISFGGKTIYSGARYNPMASWGCNSYSVAAGPSPPGLSTPRGGQAEATNSNCPDPSPKSSAELAESDSDSSHGEEVDEILDYDELLDDEDLNAEQFKVCSETLQRWLVSPDQHVTKDDIRELKRRVRDLRSQHKTLTSTERREHKRDLKALIKAMRGLARQQKKERRQLRRQERQRDCAARTERRQKSREVCRSRTEQARCRGVPTMPSALWMPPMPHVAATQVLGRHIPAVESLRSCGRGEPRGPFGGRGHPYGAYQSRPGFFPNNEVPGGWPAMRIDQSYHAGRHEGYTRAVGKLEERIMERATRLSQLESEMQSQACARGWNAKRMEGRKLALEKEIEALQSSMEGLQVDADGAYAKMVAADDHAAKG